MADLKLLPQAERLLSGKLSSGITAIATEMDVNNPPTASKLPTYFEIDYGTDDAEVVRVIGVSGNTLTIERGVNSGGVGTEHLVNANYKQKITHQFATLVTTALQNGWLPEDTSYTFTRVSTSSFKVTASGVDRTALYFAGRFIRLNGTILVTIASSSYSNPDTTIVVKETTVPTPITSIELGVSPQGVDIIAQRKATGAEINTGTEDAKIVTPEAIADSDIVFEDKTQTLTGKRITKRSGTIDSHATPTINTDEVDIFTITALATAITSMTTNLSGTPTLGQTLIIRIKDDGTARAITWGSSYASRGATLPTTTTANKTTYVGLIWNEVTNTWDCIAAVTES